MFGRYTQTIYDNRTSTGTSTIGDRRLRAGHEELAGPAHAGRSKSNLVNNFRFGRVEARADQNGIPCPQSDVDFLQLTGVFTNIPDDPARVSRRRHSGISPARGRRRQRLHGQQPADVGHQQHHDLGRGRTHLNFGFNYRRW